MAFAFEGNKVFNSDLSKWNVASVAPNGKLYVGDYTGKQGMFRSMFKNCRSFNFKDKVDAAWANLSPNYRCANKDYSTQIACETNGVGESSWTNSDCDHPSFGEFYVTKFGCESVGTWIPNICVGTSGSAGGFVEGGRFDGQVDCEQRCTAPAGTWTPAVCRRLVAGTWVAVTGKSCYMTLYSLFAVLLIYFSFSLIRSFFFRWS